MGNDIGKYRLHEDTIMGFFGPLTFCQQKRAYPGGPGPGFWAWEPVIPWDLDQPPSW